MAVSKIAVMALVGILAVPILLGYAFNLSEVAVTEYKPDNNDSVNVTQLLQNGSAYSYVHADINQLNTNFYFTNFDDKIYPYYNSITSIKTTVPLNQTITTVAAGSSIGAMTINNFSNGDIVSIHNPLDENLALYIWSNSWVEQFNRGFIKDFIYDPSTLIMTYSYYDNWVLHTSTYNVPSGDYYISLNNFSSVGLDLLKTTVSPNMNTYADLSAGFKLKGLYNIVGMPNETKSVTFTIDLNTMVDNRLIIASVDNNGNSNTPAFEIDKRDGTIFDIFINNFSGETVREVLPYDPNRTENVYQFTISKEYLGTVDDNGITRYKWNNYTSADYIGGWPSIIGVANSYWHYEYQEIHNQSIDSFIGGVMINTQTITPKIRFDDAYYNGFAYPIIEDQTYNPSNFKTNPTTTISNVQKFGYSLEFGGNSYQVDSTGNITLGTHKTSVNGLKLESVPVPVGYENKINGNVVSVTAQPSNIKFVGQWGASISTIGNSATTITKTEWIPGAFAWDGVDTNFLIVGLITCVGMFIGLGIYSRKTGKGLMPLLVVCGCASALFICLI